MFASFAQGRSGTAPKHNPFAAVPSEGETSSFGGFGAGNRNQQKPTSNNPFQRNDDAGSNGGGAGQQKGKRGGRADAFVAKSHGAGKEGRGKTRTRPDADRGNVFLARQKSVDQGSERAVSPSGDSSESESSEAADEVKVVPYNPADPLAKKVYERLRRDGISPPPWPSQPGNPNHKQAMARFREQYEAYRKKVRVSLTKAGLIDDPEKRKALSDAIEFKGICEDMCPEFEKITRITELDVVQAEKDPKTTYANTSKMVKKLARSAAGQEAPLPMDVRSIPSLRRTLDYLLDDLLRDDGNLPVVHGFLWDRTRAIRRDFSFFSSLTPEETKTQVYVLENIARFHVTSLHLLSQEGKAPEDFVQQQELEQLGKALLSLRDVYDDCGEQGITCENESEFRAYYLLFHAKDPSILETLQRQWKSRHWRDSDEVRTAVSLVEALQHTHEFHGPIKAGPSLAASAAFQTYFRIVQDPQVSYTMACFAECHFPQLRRSILQSLKRALTRPKTTAKDVTAAALNEFLQFDTVQQAIDFAEMHGLEFQSNPEDPYDIERRLLVLSDRRSLPHRRLQHHYSENMVERKRERRPLPEVIHRTVFEHAQAVPQLYGPGDEGSLFVQQDDGFGVQQFNPSAGTSSSSPFQNPWPAAAPESNAFGNQQASNSGYLGAGSQQASTTANNPFASAFTSSNHTASTGFASSTAPFASFVAPKSDGASTTGTETFGTSSQPSINPFAAAPASSAPKFSFGDQTTTSSNAFPTSQSAFPPIPSSQTTTTTSNSSLSMPPPPKPQPSLLATSPFSNTNSQTSSPFGAFFPAQDQNTPVPGQSSTAHFGSATVDGLQPASSSTASVLSGAQKSTTNAADSASSPPMSPRSTDDLKRAPSLTTATALPDIVATSTDQTAHPSPVDISAQATDSSSQGTGVQSTGSSALLDLPRDPMGDFTKWFVQGDQGLLDQFQTYVVDDILRKTFATFQEDIAEKRRKEEEDRINAEVDEFRRYNLSLKYFYRWKQNAREKRLHALRRGGRDRLRAFYVAHHAAERRARHEAVTAKQVAETRADHASAHRQEEFIDMIKRNKKMITAEARQKQALLSRRVGMPSNVATERRGDEDSTLRQEFGRSRSNSNASSYRSGDTLLDPLKGKFGAKTRALREAFLDKPEGFRRSLPSMSSMESDSASVNAPTTSNASSRWKLKAMGIEQLPDGTAVPVSMAHDMRSRPKYYSSIGLGASLDGSSLRRASIGGGSRVLDSPMRNVAESPLRTMADSPIRTMADSPIRTMVDSPIRKMGIPTVDDGLANRKRKRWSEGFQEDTDAEIEGGEGGGGEVEQNLSNNVVTPERSKPKRIMSEAEKLTHELKAMRQELENETEWFRSQNERFRSESRGPEAQTVWFDDGI